MLRREIGSTFSDVWYRVASSRPRLSPHASIVRQSYGPPPHDVAYIVEEPVGGNYYRLSEPAYFFLGLLDGRRAVEEAWDACNAQRGDDAPTQRECVELLSRLQLYGLLLGDLPIAPDMALERKRQTRQRGREKRTGRWLFLSIPIVNPERFLERHARWCRLVFSRWGLVAWSALALTAVWAVAMNWGQHRSRVDLVALLDPSNLPILGLVFLVTRAIHEMGHAAACKAFGGRVTEIGVTLIVYVLPVPYCDATSAWKFPRTRDRVIVSAAGVLTEMFFASIAAITWAFTEPGLLHAVCFNVMVLSGVTTLVFNLNPLLRYDGYYMLSDFAGSPNLSQRSRELWNHLLHRYIFGARGVQPPQVRSWGEAWLLGVFGALSGPYRLTVMVAIILLIASRYLSLGAVVAGTVLVVWFVWPLLKGVGYLASAPALIGHRARAVGAVGGMVAVLAAAVGAVPVPGAAYASGSIEPVTQSPVRVGEEGFLAQVLASPGAEVRQGDVLFVMSSPEAQTDLAVARARVRQAKAELDKASEKPQADQLLAQRSLERYEADLRRVMERVEALTVRAGVDGRFVPVASVGSDPANLEGRFCSRGVQLGNVATTGHLVVRLSVSDKDAAYIFRQTGMDGAAPPGTGDVPPSRVSIRVRGLAAEVVPGRITRKVPAGSRDMSEHSLSTTAGGDVAPDPNEPSGRRSLIPQFVVDVAPIEPVLKWQPGLRARVRFSLPAEPLAQQWWRKLRQYLKGRLG